MLRFPARARFALASTAVLATAVLVGSSLNLATASPSNPSGASVTAASTGSTVAAINTSYNMTCGNNVTSDTVPMPLQVTGNVEVAAQAGGASSLTNQHWSTTIPADVATLLRSLVGAVQVSTTTETTLTGTNTSPASVHVSPFTTVVDLSGTGAVIVGFDTPDVSFTAPAAGTTSYGVDTVAISVPFNGASITLTCHPTTPQALFSISVAPATPTAVGSLFFPISPARIIDSRPAPNRVGPLGPWGAGTTQLVSVVEGLSGVPANATAVVVNVTVTGGTVNNDYLSIWPAGTTQPTVSSLNFNPGQTVANAVTVKVGTGGANAGKIAIFNAGGSANVIVDVNGYYAAA